MNITLKVNNVPGFEGTVKVETDHCGVPLDKFWRRRLEDSITDNCVEVVKAPKRTKQAKQEQAE